MRIAVVSIILLALVGGGFTVYQHLADQPNFNYKTGKVRRGDVVASISETGTLEPEEVVDIGAQVAGAIVAFGNDTSGKPVDYNSKVEPGMLLARIDDTVYKADVDVAQAQLDQARTAIDKGNADLAQAKAKLVQAENDWKRARDLGPSDALSQNDYDMYQSNYETAEANVALANSEIKQANSGVPLAQAELDKAKRNLDYCTITSPVKGTILDRRVNIGQTVVSSLNTPSLFLIGRDLTKMQIWVSVNEADVESVVPGSAVTFTCDGFPNRVFKGITGRVRLNPQMSQNVVLYTVEVNVNNDDETLKPFKTAKVQFEVARQNDTLLAPNMALRWTPASEMQVAPDARAAWKQAQDKTADDSRTTGKERRGTIYLKDGPYVRPVDVTLGVTDRFVTAVSGLGLKEGDEIILGDVLDGGDSDAKNPFLTQAAKRR
jgi:HlyD family secretion protein